MIPVEEALRAKHDTAGLMIQNGESFAEDTTLFPEGLAMVQQLAIITAHASVYTWAAPIQKIIDSSCQDYPLEEARIAIHHFHSPTMLWMFEHPILSVVNHQDQRRASIDAVLICAWKRQRAPRPMQEFLKGFIGNFYDREAERYRIERDSTGVQFFGMNKIQGNTKVQLPIGTTNNRPIFYIPVIVGTMSFQESLLDTNLHETVKDDITIDAEINTLKRWILAGSGLLKQRILTIKNENPGRAERKRLEKDNLTGNVNVVVLRSLENVSTTSSSSVEWACRWIVQGHWRDQWYPSQKEHRIIWIPAYVKGPSSKPLILKSSIYRVNR